jgi:hypothetical protein
MKTALITTLLACMAATLGAAEINKNTPNTGNIRVVPVAPTPEPDHAEVRISFPKEGQIKNSFPIRFQFRIEGYPIGTDSTFPRQHEIMSDPQGQALRITVDNGPIIEADEALDDALDNEQNYFDQTVEVNYSQNLTPGKHIIRVFPARSFGESLKGDGCFASRVFYFQSEEDNLNVDLKAPFLTYNEPFGNLSSKKPILLDFYISNCELSKDGYKVRLTIDNTITRILTAWTPYYIYGLKQGKHTVRLQLLDSQDAQVPGVFNDVKRAFNVK